jgi:hypothetical protein
MSDTPGFDSYAKMAVLGSFCTETGGCGRSLLNNSKSGRKKPPGVHLNFPTNHWYVKIKVLLL